MHLSEYGYNQSTISNISEFPKIEDNKATNRDFVTFAIINDCSMIDARYKKGPISFQLCVGNHGEDDVQSSFFGCKKGSPCNFTEQQIPIQLDPFMPIYLATDKSKMCMTLKFPIDDLRPFLLKTNYVQSALRTIVSHFQYNYYLFSSPKSELSYSKL